MRKTREQELHFRKAVSMRDEFISIVSHELRTPMTPLKLQIDMIKRLLEKEANPSLNGILEKLATANRQVDKLNNLVGTLFDVSRIGHQQQMVLKLETLDLSRLAHEIGERYEPELARARCSLELQADHPVLIRADRVRIEQVLTNLLSNAIKYGGEKPIKISTSIQANRAVLEIQDQGIGISKADQERIFNRFERAVSFKSFGGMGLGLYIARHNVLAHGGKIGVKSDIGEGSVFMIELPHAEISS